MQNTLVDGQRRNTGDKMEQQLKDAMKGCKTFDELKQKDEVAYEMINARVL